MSLTNVRSLNLRYTNPSNDLYYPGGDYIGPTHAEARTAIEKAIKLEPNNLIVTGTAATLAGTFGQLEKSVELFEQNVRQDPLSLSSLNALGNRYAWIGRFDKALETYNRVISLNADFPGIHKNVAIVYLWKGEAETALTELEKAPAALGYAHIKVRILSTLGKEAEAQVIIDEILKKPVQLYPASMALTYAWRGENDLAFAWLDKAVEQDPGSLSYILRNRWNRKLENDHRYPSFIEKLGLLNEWKAIPKTDT